MSSGKKLALLVVLVLATLSHISFAHAVARRFRGRGTLTAEAVASRHSTQLGVPQAPPPPELLGSHPPAPAAQLRDQDAAGFVVRASVSAADGGLCAHLGLGRRNASDAFEPCWDGGAWVLSPGCSGAAASWEAALFSNEAGTACGDVGVDEVSRCARPLASFCRARSRLQGLGCRRAAGVLEVRAGDIVYLRAAETGKVLDVNASTVSARWRSRGPRQALLIEQASERSGLPVTVGAPLRLITHEGEALAVGNGTIGTLTALPLTGTDLTFEQPRGASNGSTVVVRSGDILRLRAFSDGGYVRANPSNGSAGEIVAAVPARQDGDLFVVEKELDWRSATEYNFGGTCDELLRAPKPVVNGDKVYLRTYTGMMLDADEGAVGAHWNDHGDWQALAIQTANKSSRDEIISGDAVYLKTHEGKRLAIRGDVVSADADDDDGRNSSQSLWVEKEVGGPVNFGDEIFLHATGSNQTLEIDGESVHASYFQSEKRQGLAVDDADWKETMRFVHIPKNAGTSIEEAAFSKMLRWGHLLMFGMVQMEGNHSCSTHHVPPAYAPKDVQDWYTDFETFCVTRHPYDRAVSEYNYVLSQTYNDSKKRSAEAELYSFDTCSEEGLNIFLQAKLELVRTSKAKFVNDCHFVPQTEYIWGPDRQWCADILRIEDLPDAFNNLMESRGQSMRLRGDEESKTNSHKDICPKLSVESLDNKTRSLLDEVYAADFRRLGYKTARQ